MQKEDLSKLGFEEQEAGTGKDTKEGEATTRYVGVLDGWWHAWLPCPSFPSSILVAHSLNPHRIRNMYRQRQGILRP